MTDIIAPRRGEIFTKSGEPTLRFYSWIEDQTKQTNTNVTEIFNISLREPYPWFNPQPENDSIQNSAFSFPQQTEKLRAVTISNEDYEALSNDFINAKNGATIDLPRYPEEGSIVVIRNGDGSCIKFDGNGKNINGEEDGILCREGSCLQFYYFIDSDEWFAMSFLPDDKERQISIENAILEIKKNLDILILHNEAITDSVFTEEDITE